MYAPGAEPTGIKKDSRRQMGAVSATAAAAVSPPQPHGVLLPWLLLLGLIIADRSIRAGCERRLQRAALGAAAIQVLAEELPHRPQHAGGSLH